MKLSASLLLLLGVAACDSRDPVPEVEPHYAVVSELKQRTGKLDERGRWRQLPGTDVLADVLTDEQAKSIAELEAIGYAAGSREAGEFSGVTHHEPERAWQGVNLYTSGHAPEAVLMDMDGKLLHRWRRDFLDVFPDFPAQETTPGLEYWRRAALLEGGDLLVIHEGLGIVKLDRDSNVIWARANRAHHDLEVLPDGRIWVLAREAHIVPRVNSIAPILEDFLVLLDADGEELRRISLVDCFENAGVPYAGEGAPTPSGDFMHTNALFVLGEVPEGLPAAFAPGRILTSMRFLNLVAIVDPDEERIVWGASGRFRFQHDPTLLPDGRLQLFDNMGREGRSAVLQFDPASMGVLWQFQGNARRPFYSETCGTAQALPNGNVLITETDGGRAFEITRGKELVWEFWNSHRAGPGGQYVASLFEVLRLADEGLEWIGESR